MATKPSSVIVLSARDRKRLRLKANEEMVQISTIISRDTLDKVNYWARKYDYQCHFQMLGDTWKLCFDVRTPTPKHTTARSIADEMFEQNGMRLKPIPALETLKVLMQGLLPNRGRNEKEWVQVDHETKKLQQVTTIESNIHLYFRAHILAEQQLLHAIVDFL